MLAIYDNPPREQWAELMSRSAVGGAEVQEVVERILERVRRDGDSALRELAQEIDGVELIALQLSDAEIEKACEATDVELKKAIGEAKANIEKFHRAQQREGVDVETSAGVRCVQRSVPIERVGLYIPGGTAPLFSTVLMLAVPAVVAGCREIVMCTPVGRNGEVASAVVYAAKVCGVQRIYKVGGAQAVGAMAYGTETVGRVDKIFGPGNQYVTTAKQLVGLSQVAIDMPAGPSEVMVMADATARAEFVAADLLSQAEHGADSQSMLVCSSREIAERVQTETFKQLENLSRKELAQRSLENSRIVVLASIDDMVAFANEYAAEHLIIAMSEPWSVADRITAAGSVFVGNYSPESAGDYASGTNHTLPTSGWARSMSGVNLDSFTKRITYQELTQQGLCGLSQTIIQMAEAEGLQAHANAVKIRVQ